MRHAPTHYKRDSALAGNFVATIKQAADAEGGVATFDSAAASDFVKQATDRTGMKLPGKLEALFDEVGKDGSSDIASVLLDCANAYEKEHGCPIPNDLAELAIHDAWSTTQEARRVMGMSLDSASNTHQDNFSLQPNRAVIAIMSAFGDPIPWAHYLPADIGSNEAKVAILSHVAGSTFGSYTTNDSMDGINSGDAYVGAARTHKCAVHATDGTFSGKLTAIQTDEDTCDVGGAEVPLIRGRSIIYIQGMRAAVEVSQSGSGASAISGTVDIGGTSYAVGGTINTDTGVIAGTTTPAIPNTLEVVARGFIDYERNEGLVPYISTNVDTFSLFATPWRVKTQTSIDARSQLANELGLDAFGESVVAINRQYANERHYTALYMAKRLAVNNTGTFDFDWPNLGPDKSREMVWGDLCAKVAELSQQMAEDTMDHGITHWYVGKFLLSLIRSLPMTMFVPSGIEERPGIFRAGRMMGKWDIYYTPKGITETSTASQILLVGRASDVARNPIVLGDAMAPNVTPLNPSVSSVNSGAFFYARNFTEVNPHATSARGCALLDVTNLL